MLFLLFQGGNDRYALSTQDVVEVLPLVSLKSIPQAPHWVSGVFNYHGHPVPVIDVTQLMAERSSRHIMSTRIIVVNVRGEDSKEHMLGLLAESVMETLRLNDKDFVDSGVAPNATSYLGRVATVKGSLVQRVDAQSILNDDVRSLLFQERTS